MPKQAELIEGRGIPELDSAAEEVRELTDERMLVHKKEISARDTLLHLMREYKKATYRYNGYLAKIVPGIEKVSVRRINEKKAKPKGSRS